MLGMRFICGTVVSPVAVRIAWWRLGHVLNLAKPEQARLEAMIKDYYRRKK